MKRSMRIALLATALCAVMGVWAAAFARAEAEKTNMSAAVDAGIGLHETNATAVAVDKNTAVAASTATGTAAFEKSELFSDRDLLQEVDLADAVTYEVADGQDIEITKAGVYVLTGAAGDVTVTVAADKKDKVQLVLEGLTLTNGSEPAIYVKSADKVFVTTAADSSLAVTGTFAADGDTNTDGVIFSKSDLVLNGTASLAITSTNNGVVSKDDLKVTGGTYTITAAAKALEANDSIRVADGELTLTAGTDGLHAENDDDDTKGYIYIGGGSLTIRAGDDGLHATTVVQVDDGALAIAASEGIEATYVQLNGGSISIDGQDDGINAAQKSSGYRATVEINGGDITVAMAAGDTDGIDSNGDIIVNGGTIAVTGNSTFDYDGTGTLNGGTVIVNGQQVTTLPNQMFGGRGGFGGGFGNWGGSGGFGGRGGVGGFGGRGWG